MDAQSPFGLILLAQPMFRRRLRLGAFVAYVALDQRVSLRVQLEGMERAESGEYLRHHLSLCGRSDPLFSDDAVAVLHHASRGLPRALNNLALQALIATFAESKGIVDERAAKMAVVEVNGE